MTMTPLRSLRETATMTVTAESGAIPAHFWNRSTKVRRLVSWSAESACTGPTRELHCGADVAATCEVPLGADAERSLWRVLLLRLVLLIRLRPLRLQRLLRMLRRMEGVS